MKKNILLLLIAVFTLFISACGDNNEEGIAAGDSCSSEGLEICSDDGSELLLCQDSAWVLKKQCNISIGKRCKQNSAGVFGCFSEGNTDSEDHSYPDSSDTNNEEPDSSDHNTEEPDTNNTSDTENETPDSSNTDTSEDPTDTDDSDTIPQTDSDNTNDPNDEAADNDADNDSDNDTDTDNNDTEQPSDQCSLNSDCSDPTPYCSRSTSQCIANAVFITEYVEGSNDNKAIEIYNGSKSPVNLSNFTIQQANNGKNWGSDPTNFIFNFPAASLSSGKTFVFCNVASDPELVAKCDQTPTSEVFKFSGDDGIALFDGNSIVDQIGIQGQGTNVKPWSVAGVPSATEAHTLRRKLSVIQGTTDWALSAGTTEENSEWEVLAKDTFDGLGSR